MLGLEPHFALIRFVLSLSLWMSLYLYIFVLCILRLPNCMRYVLLLDGLLDGKNYIFCMVG